MSSRVVAAVVLVGVVVLVWLVVFGRVPRTGLSVGVDGVWGLVVW